MFPTWYRFQITSVLSILHRLTGIALAMGSILLAWWLVAVAAGGEVFAATHAFIASPIGVLNEGQSHKPKCSILGPRSGLNVKVEAE
jgi:succinate dehydrogenase/fumarate reductase cytochrome b subunit